MASRTKSVKKTHSRPKTKVNPVEPEAPATQAPVQTSPMPAPESALLAVSPQTLPEVTTPPDQQESTAPFASLSAETQSTASSPTIPVNEPAVQTASIEVRQLASIPVEPPIPTRPAPPPKNRLAWVILIFLLILGTGLAAWAIYDSLSKSKQTQPTAQGPRPTFAVASPTSMPASPSPSPDKKNLKIQILNGSGVPGAAGVAREKLKATGYEDITIGNAASYDFDKVEISLKADKMSYFDLLVSDLGSAYTVASAAATLASRHPYDVVIVIGQQ